MRPSRRGGRLPWSVSGLPPWRKALVFLGFSAATLGLLVLLVTRAYEIPIACILIGMSLVLLARFL